MTTRACEACGATTAGGRYCSIECFAADVRKEGDRRERDRRETETTTTEREGDQWP